MVKNTLLLTDQPADESDAGRRLYPQPSTKVETCAAIQESTEGKKCADRWLPTRKSVTIKTSLPFRHQPWLPPPAQSAATQTRLRRRAPRRSARRDARARGGGPARDDAGGGPGGAGGAAAALGRDGHDGRGAVGGHGPDRVRRGKPNSVGGRGALDPGEEAGVQGTGGTAAVSAVGAIGMVSSAPFATSKRSAL